MTLPSRTRALAALGVLSLGVAGLTVVAVAAPVQADSPTTTFTSSGVYTVPADITSVHVVATGGSGGRSFSDFVAGGSGAVVEADLAVTPGQQLMVHVGGRGGNGSYPGGGGAGANGGAASGSFTSGGGGGASDVRLAGDTLADRLLVAAGGGGATYMGSGSLTGGNAGAAGTRSSACASGTPAQPGTQVAGGLGSRSWGDCAYLVPGGDGSLGVGGAGGFDAGSNNSGGGGGGGWYGGGGGGQLASGAGGSSYVSAVVGSNAATSLATNGVLPQVVISYDKLAQEVTFADGIPSTVVAGTSYEVAATGGASGHDVTFSLGAATTAGACTLSGTTLTFAHAGACVVDADQLGDDSYVAGSATHTIDVDPAGTTTSLHVAAGTVSADVLVSDPSTLDPEGTVQFLLGDEVAGSAPLVNGTATLDQAVPDGAADTVTAKFVGTSDLATSSDDSTRAPQEITFEGSTPTTAVAGTTHPVDVTGGGSAKAVRLTAGAATTASSCTVSGTTATFAHAGTCQLVADQDGDWLHLPATATRLIEVAQAATSTTMSVQPQTVTATVTAGAPSALTPGGTVRFLVGGSVVGTADLVGGKAVLSYAVPTGATRTVSAEYLGSADAVASSASATRSDPTIAATVTSARTPIAGWYRTPVTVSFACQEKGSAVLSCPLARVLTKSAARQTATGTVTAADGGAATVTVSGISIDTVAPKLKVAGVKNGKKYVGKKTPKPRCVAKDALSGLARCTVSQSVIKRAADRVVMRYTAIARDRAGNTTKVVGKFTLLFR